MRFAFAPSNKGASPAAVGTERRVKDAAAIYYGNTDYPGADHSLSELAKSGHLKQTPFREVHRVVVGSTGRDSRLIETSEDWVDDIWTISEIYEERPIDDEFLRSMTNQINDWRKRIEESGFIWSPTGLSTDERPFQSDEQSSQRILGTMQLANEIEATGRTFSLDWLDADNKPVALDLAGIRGLCLALGSHTESAFWLAQAKKAELAAATTRAQVRAIIGNLTMPETQAVNLLKTRE